MSPTPTGLPESVPVKQLDRKNAEWTLFHEMWASVSLLYEGGVKLKNNGQSFLMKRPKELFDVYQERYRRLTYQNILQNCVSWYTAKLFQREPVIEPKTTDKRITDFLQDCDRSGTPFVEFARQVIETMILYRRAFVLIDKPRPAAGEPPATRAQEQQQGLDQPYLVLYDPMQMFNWALDQYGNLNWAIIKTIAFDQPGPLDKIQYHADWFVYDKTNYYHYRFTAPDKMDEAQLLRFYEDAASTLKDGDNDSATLIDQGKHALSAESRVPIRVCGLPLNLWFSNRAYLHLLEHLDFLNSYSWKLFVANHPQLVIQSEKEIGAATMSEVSFLQLGKDDKVFYLEPDGKSFQESRLYLQMMREEIYRGFHLQAQGKSSTATAEGASGYSKELEMAPAVDILNAVGVIMRGDQQNILLDVKAAANLPTEGEENTPSVNGYRFETKPALSDIDQAQALIDTGVTDKSPTLEKVVDKRIAMTVADGENEDIKKQIADEIDKAPTRIEQKNAEEQAQQQAFGVAFQRANAKDVLASEKESVAA